MQEVGLRTLDVKNFHTLFYYIPTTRVRALKVQTDKEFPCPIPLLYIDGVQQ
jgi:hypothetical protein